MFSDTVFNQLVTEAQNPATSPEKLQVLYILALQVHNESSHQRGHFSRLQDEGPEHHAKGSYLLQAIALNPNCSIEVLMSITPYAPEAVLQNPMFPLLALEDPEFSLWNQTPIAHLRLTMLHVGHSLFPGFTKLCRDSWHYLVREQGKDIISCHDHLCAHCYPQEAEIHLANWRAIRTGR